MAPTTEREITVELPLERLTTSYTLLGQVIEALASVYATVADKTPAAVARLTNPPVLTDEAQSQGVSDPGGFVRRIEAERDALTRHRAEAQKALVSVLGEASSPALLDAYLGVRDDMLEIERAQRLGLLDVNTSNEGLRVLRKKLEKARAAAMGTGAEAGVLEAEKNSVLRTSRWARLGGVAREGFEVVGKAAEAGLGQVTGIASGLMGLARSLPIAGGLFGLMLWGVTERDRLQAQLGEVVNLSVAAGGGAHDRGVAWLSGFQERAQNFYGISRKEIQANVRAFVGAGLTFNEIFQGEHRGLGEVGSNNVALTVGLDRHFELAGGTTARTAAKMVGEYGMGLHAAVESLSQIEVAAQKGGFGVGGFLTWLMAAGANTRSLGVKLQDIAASVLELQRQYGAMGLGRPASARAAQQGMEEMLGGFAREDLGREIYAAEQMGLGQGLAGRQALREGLVEGRSDVLAQRTQLLRKEALEAGMGNELHARYYLEQRGFGFEGSRAILALGKQFEQGVKLEQLSADDKKALRQAYTDEGKKTSDHQKNIKTMLAGMARMGEGFLLMFTNFAAIAITGMKTIPVLLAGSDVEKKAVFEQFQSYNRGLAEGWAKVWSGSREALHGLDATVGPLIAPIKRAIDWQYTTGLPSALFEEAAPATEAGGARVMDDVFRRITGRPLDDAERHILFPPGMSSDEASRLASTPEGRAELLRRKQAQIEAERTARAQAEARPGTPGQAPRSGPATKSLLPEVDFARTGLGSLSRTNPMLDAPLPSEVRTPAGTKPAPHGPTGALRIETRWAPGADPSQPLVVEVEVTG
jgi:hypothetical protein